MSKNGSVDYDNVKDQTKVSTSTGSGSNIDNVPEYQKRRKHKPAGFPKRPLSAYNIFFKETRHELLTSVAEKTQRNDGDNEIMTTMTTKKEKKNSEKSRIVGEEIKEEEKEPATPLDHKSMVKEIASRWKNLPENKRKRVVNMAENDLKRYQEEVAAYKKKEEEMKRQNKRKKLEEAKIVERQREQQELLQHQQQQQKEEQQKRMKESMPSSSTSTAVQGGEGRSEAQAHHPESELESLFAEELIALNTIQKLQHRQMELVQNMEVKRPYLTGVKEKLFEQRQMLGLSPLGSIFQRNTAASTSACTSASTRAIEAEKNLRLNGGMTHHHHHHSTMNALGATSLAPLPPMDNSTEMRLGLMRHPAAPSSSSALSQSYPLSSSLDSYPHHRHPGGAFPGTTATSELLRREEELLYHRSRQNEMMEQQMMREVAAMRYRFMDGGGLSSGGSGGCPPPSLSASEAELEYLRCLRTNDDRFLSRLQDVSRQHHHHHHAATAAEGRLSMGRGDAHP